MTTDEVLASLPTLSALVVGDVCLDRWCFYDPQLAEPSRETTIPRVAVVEYERTPGAAGTVASNLSALGVGRVAVLGVVGDDGHGFEMERALDARRIEHSALVRNPSGLTFTYTKLINCSNGVEDLPRVDYLTPRDLPEEVTAQVVERFEQIAPQFDVVLISDQMEISAGGVVSARLRDAISRFAAGHPKTVVLVDSRARGELFRNVLVKLNEDEAAQVCARLHMETDYEKLRGHIGYSSLMVTHGPGGVVVVDANGVTSVPTKSVANPVDICGAGDSFSAGASLVLRLTGDPVQAARFGNLIASITIMQRGTGAATPELVRQASKLGDQTMSYFASYRQSLESVLNELDLQAVETAAEWLRAARDEDRQIFVCGNGGSAFTASHFATDLLKGASYQRPRRFRIQALTDNIGTITAYANDVSYEAVFEEQLKNFAAAGDLVIAISGSGNSPNVVRAVEYANETGCRTIGLTGRDGGRLGKAVQLNILAAEPHMGRIEDVHMFVCHMLAYSIMEENCAS